MRRTAEVVQLSFPFVWEAIDLMRLADKKKYRASRQMGSYNFAPIYRIQYLGDLKMDSDYWPEWLHRREYALCVP